MNSVVLATYNSTGGHFKDDAVAIGLWDEHVRMTDKEPDLQRLSRHRKRSRVVRRCRPRLVSRQ